MNTQLLGNLTRKCWLDLGFLCCIIFSVTVHAEDNSEVNSQVPMINDKHSSGSVKVEVKLGGYGGGVGASIDGSKSSGNFSVNTPISEHKVKVTNEATDISSKEITKNQSYESGCSLDGKTCVEKSTVGMPIDNKILNFGRDKEATTTYSTNSIDFKKEVARDIPYNRSIQPVKTTTETESYYGNLDGVGVKKETTKLPYSTSSDEERLCKNEPERCFSATGIRSEKIEVSYGASVPVTGYKQLKIEAEGGLRIQNQYFPNKETYEQKADEQATYLQAGNHGLSENYKGSRITDVSVFGNTSVIANDRELGVKVNINAEGEIPIYRIETTPDEEALNPLNNRGGTRNKLENEFSELAQRNNEATQMKLREQSEFNQNHLSKNSANDNDLSVITDVFSAIVTGVAETKNQKQNSNSNSSSSCAKKTFNTPDGCHPNHDEKNHPGGCYCD